MTEIQWRQTGPYCFELVGCPIAIAPIADRGWSGYVVSYSGRAHGVEDALEGALAFGRLLQENPPAPDAGISRNVGQASLLFCRDDPARKFAG